MPAFRFFSLTGILDHLVYVVPGCDDAWYSTLKLFRNNNMLLGYGAPIHPAINKRRWPQWGLARYHVNEVYFSINKLNLYHYVRSDECVRVATTTLSLEVVLSQCFLCL